MQYIQKIFSVRIIKKSVRQTPLIWQTSNQLMLLRFLHHFSVWPYRDRDNEKVIFRQK